MTRILVVPGLGGSEQDHWQSHVERGFLNARRVDQPDWDRPGLEQWLANLYAAVQLHPDCLLVAHSLGCALVAHFAVRFPKAPVRAALLVAPADVDSEHHTPECLRGFAPMPRPGLPFRSLVVASTNDPFMDFGRARGLAEAWGAEFVDGGAVGHINVASGFGRWTFGEGLIRELADERNQPGYNIAAARSPWRFSPRPSA